MKALVKQQAAPGIWLEDVPEPRVGPNDVLIEIAKTAICGTDMHIYNWDPWAQKTIPVPMAVGHEYCGRIDAVARGGYGAQARQGPARGAARYCDGCRISITARAGPPRPTARPSSTRAARLRPRRTRR